MTDYFDGTFEVDPEPDDSGAIEDAEITPEGDLHVEFSNGIQVTAFGPAAQEPPYKTWQLQAR